MSSSVLHRPKRSALIAEQRALRRALGDVTVALSGRGPRRDGGPDAVAARLDLLRGRVAAHFAAEERLGLFERILEGAPEHARACERLREDHIHLLQRLDELRGGRPEGRRRAEWTAAVRALLDEISGHEARENDLIVAALGGIPGEGD